MKKITPFLWFNDQAGAAAKFYTTIFKRSKIVRIDRYGPEAAAAAGRPRGSVMAVAFELEGQPFIALNGGPVFTINEAISFVVDCRTQQEVDRLWKRLTARGGAPGQCGWLKDRFGVTWQIVPSALDRMLRDRDPEKAGRVWKAMLTMRKLDLAALRKAYAGRA
ncbi:MAG: VOC family protein [Nitrospirae bacterium]|nr:VOC family protein [Nitrospirota bacterium]